MAADLFRDLVVSNPKRQSDRSPLSGDRLFSYYAGYSVGFAEDLILSARRPPGSVILDPWNGAGTTTLVARRLGLRARGFDLNPAMVVAAKASLLSARECSSLLPLGTSIATRSKYGSTTLDEEPLEKWFSPESARQIRNLEHEINRTLVRHSKYALLKNVGNLNGLSSLASFFYVALFRATKKLVLDFVPTNPTWVTSPNSHRSRKRPSYDGIVRAFLGEVDALSNALAGRREFSSEDTVLQTVELATSEDLPVSPSTVDMVVSSPPYCTRIDYAIATSVELAVLRFGAREFDKLRRKLMGAAVVSADSGSVKKAWGETCGQFLEGLYSHRSKASKSYYFRSHIQYFSSLYASIDQISKALRKQAICVLVVQDSHYKEIHNDLPTITAEMATNCGLALGRRENFRCKQSMVIMNSKSRKYLDKRHLTESVLCFEK